MRKRQALRCSARRTNGQPCKAYAVTGTTVCRSHGAAAPQTKQAAQLRLIEADINRAATATYARWQKQYREWQINRIAVASVLTGLPVSDFFTPDGDVNVLLIAWCRVEHGKPGGPESAPILTLDRRFRIAKTAPTPADHQRNTSLTVRLD